MDELEDSSDPEVGHRSEMNQTGKVYQEDGERFSSTYRSRIHMVIDVGGGQSLTMVRRQYWGAEQAEPIRKDQLTGFPMTHVVYQQTNTEWCLSMVECTRIMKDLQASDRASGLSDIRHNFYVGGDSKVYFGRGWYEKPTLPPEHEHLTDHALSIGFIGDFLDKNPPFAMTFTALDLVKLGLKKGFLKSTFKLIQLKKSSIKI